MLILAAVCASLVACGGRSKENGAVEQPKGGSASQGGSGTDPSPGGAGNGGLGGVPNKPPGPVDPAVSRTWSWQPCGTLEPEAPDEAAAFDAEGRIVVLGPGGLRLHAPNGERLELPSGVKAEFLMTASDGSVLSGRRTDAGIALTPVGEITPSIVLPLPPATTCGTRFSMSSDGAYVLATGGEHSCAWRIADSSFLESVFAEQVAIRDSQFVSIEEGIFTEVVHRDLDGLELSRLPIGEGEVVLSPAGDRAYRIADGALIDLDSAEVIPWDEARLDVPFPEPVFSPRGEMVLLWDGVFSTADGVRRFTLVPGGRVSDPNASEVALAPDGRRAVAFGFARATVFDVEAAGVAAVLGPPVVPWVLEESGGVTDLAVSRDGSLLVYNVEGSLAYGIQLAPRFGDSKVLWDMRVEINMGVDVSADGRLSAVGGDGRALYDGRDGSAVWPATIPPPIVPPSENCLMDRLRFSPRSTWLASSFYSGGLQVFALEGEAAWQPLVELPGRCDAAAFSRDERAMATSAAALYYTGPSSDWQQVWSSPLPSHEGELGYAGSNVTFSPDDSRLLVSRCAQWSSSCVTTLLDAATGRVIRQLKELVGPDPEFSPDGSWVVAANQLLHLASGEVRSLGANASATNPAIFTPDGDIIAGEPTGAITRYCREE